MKKPIKTSDEIGAIEFIPNQVEDIHEWLMRDTNKTEDTRNVSDERCPFPESGYYTIESHKWDTRTMREVLLSIESLLKEICQKR